MKKIDLKNKILINKFPKATYENVFYEACLNNLDRSEIYVDNIENPKFILFIFKGKEGALYGQMTEDILEKIQYVIKNKNPEVLFLPLIEEDIINKIFGEVEILNRNFYVFKNHKTFARKHEVYKYDLKSAKRITLEIDYDFEIAWDTSEEFIKYGGFGYYIEKDGKIISTAWSYFPSDKRTRNSYYN